MEYGKARSLTPQDSADFTVAPGNGLTATVAGKKLVGGNYRFIRKQAPVPQDLK